MSKSDQKASQSPLNGFHGKVAKWSFAAIERSLRRMIVDRRPFVLFTARIYDCGTKNIVLSVFVTRDSIH
jgi:hypothetical protein